MTHLKIIRLGISPYQNQQFPLWEKTQFNELSPQLSYAFQTELKELQSDSIIITNTNIQTDFLKNLCKEKLKLIIHPNSGYDNFSAKLVATLDCPIIIGHGIRAQAVAEYILACLFQHFTAPPFSRQWDPSRTWQRELLCHKKVLILGHGHIGKILEQSLKPLVKNICIYDPYKGKKTLDLTDADIIIPAASLNHSSEHMINTEFLQKISQRAVIINASRGKIIHEQQLCQWLQAHPHAFAYLDVFAKEPHDFASFKNLPNCQCTSHVAGVFRHLDEKILAFERLVVQKYLAGFDFFSPHEFNKACNLKNKLCNQQLI